MTNQHLADLLEAQRRLLWPLPAAERQRVIAEVEADYVLEIQLEAVAVEMETA